jgi:MFS family permease
MREFARSLWTRLLGEFNSVGFVRLVQTHLLSAAGDALVAVALAGSVFFSEDPNTARERVALSLVMTMAPFAIVAPFIGPIIDRVPGGRKLVLMAATGCRAILCLLMATSLDSVALYPIAFLSLVFSKTHAVAKSAAVPEIVDDEKLLVKANSILAVSAVVSSFVVGGLGYAFSAVIGEAWVLRVGAVLFVVAAALSMEVGIKNVRRAEESAETTATKLRDTGVLVAGAVMATLRASVGFLAFLIAFDLRRAEAATIWFGFAISAGMIGSSLGNLIAPRIRGHVREETMLIAAPCTVGVVALVLTQWPGRYASAGLALVLGLVTATAKLAFDSLVQRDAPSAVQARSFARFEAVFQLVWVFGALAPVTFTISTVLGYLLLAVAAIGSAVWYAISPRRKLTVAASTDPG